MLHFLHRRCRLQRHDDFINVDDAGWYQPLVYPIFASCVGGLISFGLKNENVGKFMMMTETQIWQVSNIRMKKLIIVKIHLDMGNRFQFYINLTLDNSGAPNSCGFLCPGVVGAGTFCSSRRIPASFTAGLGAIACHSLIQNALKSTSVQLASLCIRLVPHWTSINLPNYQAVSFQPDVALYYRNLVESICSWSNWQILYCTDFSQRQCDV